jgi:hypothetical protein
VLHGLLVLRFLNAIRGVGSPLGLVYPVVGGGSNLGGARDFNNRLLLLSVPIWALNVQGSQLRWLGGDGVDFPVDLGPSLLLWDAIQRFGSWIFRVQPVPLSFVFFEAGGVSILMPPSPFDEVNHHAGFRLESLEDLQFGAARLYVCLVVCVRMLHKRSSRHGRFRPSNSRQEGTKIAKGVRAQVKEHSPKSNKYPKIDKDTKRLPKRDKNTKGQTRQPNRSRRDRGTEGRAIRVRPPGGHSRL